MFTHSLLLFRHLFSQDKPSCLPTPVWETNTHLCWDKHVDVTSVRLPTPVWDICIGRWSCHKCGQTGFTSLHIQPYSYRFLIPIVTSQTHFAHTWCSHTESLSFLCNLLCWMLFQKKHEKKLNKYNIIISPFC